jgi:hypothetical protein
MKANAGVGVQIHVFLTLALVGGVCSASGPCRFTPGERSPGTHWIGGWVDLRAGLNKVEKRKFLTLPGFELRLFGRPARSRSLYRLNNFAFFTSPAIYKLKNVKDKNQSIVNCNLS